jgi:hypothetical protein
VGACLPEIENNLIQVRVCVGGGVGGWWWGDGLCMCVEWSACGCLRLCASHVGIELRYVWIIWASHCLP